MFNFFENPKNENKPDLSKDIQWIPTKSKNNPEYLNVTVAVRRESPYKDSIESALMRSNFSPNQGKQEDINSTYYGLIRADQYDSLKSKIDTANFDGSDGQDFKQAA